MRNSSSHIIHISTARTWRGGEQQLAYLIKALDTSGLTQEVLCTAGSAFADYCRKHAIKATEFRKRSSVDLRAPVMLKRMSRRHQKTIIHCHDSHAHNIAWISALLFGNRTPVVVHRRVDFPVKNSFLSKAKYNHPAIAHFICVSEAIRQILLPAIKHPGRVSTVYSGIDLTRFEGLEPTDSLRKELGLTPETTLIGNVSAIAPHKDCFTFVRTAEVLLRNKPELRFVIIGDGPERGAIEKEIKIRGLAEKIFLTGFKTGIPGLLKELNVLLLTSKTEGLGTILLDAFAARVPVVATRAGGIPELVENEVTGLLAGVQDAENLAYQTLRLLEDNKLRQRLIDNSALKVQNFSYEATAEKIIEIYNQISGEKQD